MLFVDGLGLGEQDPSRNPLYEGSCPHLLEVIEQHGIEVDAGLGVRGAPQSATGQATLLTGVNAAAAMGRHIEGRPGPKLKELVRENNLFDQFTERGYQSTFANGYYVEDSAQVVQMRHQSVTTVAALKAFGGVRCKGELHRNEAVYHDIVRVTAKDRGYEGEMISESDAAEHLSSIARDHDFTLFEYFLTDLMAHRGTHDDVLKVLGSLDRFIIALIQKCDEQTDLFVMTSDHGNIEDRHSRSHTQNPVPFVAIGRGADQLKEKVRALDDCVPALMSLYPAKR